MLVQVLSVIRICKVKKQQTFFPSYKITGVRRSRGGGVFINSLFWIFLILSMKDCITCPLLTFSYCPILFKWAFFYESMKQIWIILQINFYVWKHMVRPWIFLLIELASLACFWERGKNEISSKYLRSGVLRPWAGMGPWPNRSWAHKRQESEQNHPSPGPSVENNLSSETTSCFQKSWGHCFRWYLLGDKGITKRCGLFKYFCIFCVLSQKMHLLN